MNELHLLTQPLWTLRREIEREVGELTATQQRLDEYFASPGERDEQIALLADLNQRLITLTGTNQRVLETLYDLMALTDQLRERRPK